MKRWTSLHAWLLEDDDLDASIAERMLVQIGVRVRRSREVPPLGVPTADEVDLIVLDIGLGRESGLDVLRRLREAGDRRPALVLTGRSDSCTAMECVRAGADDFVCKAELHAVLLERAVENALLRSEARDRERERDERIEERSLLSARLARLETTDPLTDLANRRVFEERLDQEILSARRYGTVPALLWIDVDGFKGINDACGHGEGDRLLREVGGVLKTVIRRTDLSARVGGDEFAVILLRGSVEVACSVAARIIEQASGIHWGEAKRPVELSVGIAIYRLASTAEDLVRRADEALYEAKQSGESVRVEATRADAAGTDARFDGLGGGARRLDGR